MNAPAACAVLGTQNLRAEHRTVDMPRPRAPRQLRAPGAHDRTPRGAATGLRRSRKYGPGSPPRDVARLCIQPRGHLPSTGSGPYASIHGPHRVEGPRSALAGETLAGRRPRRRPPRTCAGIRRERPARNRARLASEPHLTRVRVVLRRQPPPEMSAVIGDAVHNLRSALDSVAYATVVADHDSEWNPADDWRPKFPSPRTPMSSQRSSETAAQPGRRPCRCCAKGGQPWFLRVQAQTERRRGGGMAI